MGHAVAVALAHTFCPLFLLTSNTVVFAGISVMCVYLYLRISPCATCLFIFVPPLQFCILFTHISLSVPPYWHVCGYTRMTFSVYCVALLCLCQQHHVCKACYMKSEDVEPSAEASEFICIHSTACLSSEPILITSSSGLLQDCAYALSVKNGPLVVHSCGFDNTLLLACQKSLDVVLFAIKPQHFSIF